MIQTDVTTAGILLSLLNRNFLQARFSSLSLTKQYLMHYLTQKHPKVKDIQEYHPLNLFLGFL